MNTLLMVYRWGVREAGWQAAGLGGGEFARVLN